MTEFHRWLVLATCWHHGPVHETLGRTAAGVGAELAGEHGVPKTVAAGCAPTGQFGWHIDLTSAATRDLIWSVKHAGRF